MKEVNRPDGEKRGVEEEEGRRTRGKGLGKVRGKNDEASVACSICSTRSHIRSERAVPWVHNGNVLPSERRRQPAGEQHYPFGAINSD